MSEREYRERQERVEATRVYMEQFIDRMMAEAHRFMLPGEPPPSREECKEAIVRKMEADAPRIAFAQHGEGLVADMATCYMIEAIRKAAYIAK